MTDVAAKRGEWERQRIRDLALEEAAQACEREAKKSHSAYRAAMGFACADAVRRLKESGKGGPR